MVHIYPSARDVSGAKRGKLLAIKAAEFSASEGIINGFNSSTQCRSLLKVTADRRAMIKRIIQIMDERGSL